MVYQQIKNTGTRRHYIVTTYAVSAVGMPLIAAALNRRRVDVNVEPFLKHRSFFKVISSTI